MAKVILNQTISRPILYNFVQQKIAEAPSECKDKLNAEKKKFMATIKPIKEFAQNKLNNLYPQEDLKILTKYNLSNKESCFGRDRFPPAYPCRFICSCPAMPPLAKPNFFLSFSRIM